MRRRIIVAGILSILAGCNEDPVSTGQHPPPVPVPPISTYRLVGTVRDENNSPIRGASVTLTDAAQQSRQTVTDSTGRFEFQGLTGVFTVVVRSENYRSAFHYLFISTDRVLDVNMIPIMQELIIELGKEYDFTIRGTDAPCDPERWDAHAPCAKISLRAPQSGVLKVELTWASEGEVDFTIMSESAAYLTYSGDGPVLAATAPVVAGGYYYIWVHSYYGSATFRVRGDIVP